MSIGFWDKLTHVLKPLSGVTNLFGRTKAGLTPQAPSGNGTTHYLREDGEWVIPPNDKVTQINVSTDNANYRVLMSGTADDTQRTESVRKDTDLTYNPSTNQLNVSKVNGVAKTLARSGNLDFPMTFNWSGQNGQPSWLWGSNNGTNISVWNPLNFRVAQADKLTNLAFKTIIAKTITGSWAANAEITAGQVGYASGKFLVFFNIQWFQGNVWFHLIDVATGAGIANCVGGSNASGMAVGWLDMASDRWLRVTCDAAFTNNTVAINVSLLRLSA